MSLKVPGLQIVFELPYTGKSSLDLSACLRRPIEENIPESTEKIFKEESIEAVLLVNATNAFKLANRRVLN